MNLLIFLSILWSVISVIVYATYKLGDSPSWEESLKRFMRCIVEQLREAFTAPCETNEGAELVLADSEPLQLVEALEQQPYETPALANYQIINGAMTFDVRAAGLAPKYNALEANSPELTRLLQLKIYNYFMKVRGIPVHVCIRFATPMRLSFAVPFTNGALEKLRVYEAKRSLERKRAKEAAMPGKGKAPFSPDFPAVLEESVPVEENDAEAAADEVGVSP